MEGRPIESVVVAYDGSEPSRRALDRTAEIVRDAAFVTVVSVVPQRMTSLGPEPLDPAASTSTPPSSPRPVRTSRPGA